MRSIRAYRGGVQQFRTILFISARQILVTILIGAPQLPAVPQSYVGVPRDVFESSMSDADFRALNYPGDSRCWSDGVGFNWDTCCSRRNLGDVAGCFDDVFFSYELCCFPIMLHADLILTSELDAGFSDLSSSDIVNYWLADVFKMEMPPPAFHKDNEDDQNDDEKNKCDTTVEATASGSTDRAESPRLPAFDFASRPKNFYVGTYSGSKRINDTRLLDEVSDKNVHDSDTKEDICLYSWRKVKTLGCGCNACADLVSTVTHDNSTVFAVRRFEVFQQSAHCHHVDCPNPMINYIRAMKVLTQIDGDCPHMAPVVDFCINDATVEGGEPSVTGKNVFMEYAGSMSVGQYFLGWKPSFQPTESAWKYQDWKAAPNIGTMETMETETESSSPTRDVPKRKISANVLLAWIKQLFLEVAPGLARRGVVIQDLHAGHVILPDVIQGCDGTANASRVTIIDSSAYFPAYFFGLHLSASEVTAINIYMIICVFFAELFTIKDWTYNIWYHESAVFYEEEREVIHFIYRRLFGYIQSLRIPSLGVFGNDLRWINKRVLDAVHTMSDLEQTINFIWPSDADRRAGAQFFVQKSFHHWPYFRKELQLIPMMRWAKHYARHPVRCAAPQFRNLDWLNIDKDNSSEVFAICGLIHDEAYRCTTVGGFPNHPPCDFFENDTQFFM